MGEKVYFQNSDNLKLCGILSKAKNPLFKNKCIVLCHGITVDKNESNNVFGILAKALNNVGFDVFRFDFRGHGESEGNSIDLTIAGEEKDLEAAVAFLKDKGYLEFGILGASFGGGAVCYYSSKHQDTVKAVILMNSVIDYAENLNPTLPWTKKYWGKAAFEKIDKFGYTEIGSKKFKIGKEFVKDIKTLKPWIEALRLKIPVLFVHGDKDTYVSYNDSVKYSKMLENPQLVTIKGGEHGFSNSKEHLALAKKAIIDFFLKNLF